MAESLTRVTKCVCVDTSLDTHLLLLLHHHETISDFKVKLCKEHLQCFPQLGKIDISAVKVNRENTSGLLLDYHLPDSTLLGMVLDGMDRNCWSVFVDAAVKVEKCEQDKNDSLLLDGCTKNHSLEEDLEAEKTTNKRKLKVSDGQKKRKKSKDDINQSSAASAAITASEYDVDESHELRRNVQLEVVSTKSSPRKKLDDTLAETTTKETEKSVEEDVGRVNVETDDVVSHQANHLDTSSGLATRSDTEKKKRKKRRSKDDTNQSSNVVSVVATPPESLPASGEENIGNPFGEATQKEVEKSVEAEGIDKVETDDLVSHMENHLVTNTGLTARPDTEKKSSENDTNLTSAPTHASLPISRGKNLDDSFAVVASKKENELVQISIDDVGRDQIETAKLVSRTANCLYTVSEVTTRPDAEKKKKRRQKRSKEISISSVTTSRDIVNEIKEVPANVYSVDAAKEPDNIIRNVSGYLQENNETNASLEVAQSQELSVEVDNAALEETPLMIMDNPQATESDASLLRKSSEVAEDKSLSKKSLKEKVDMGDNFGCSQNQEKPDQVAGGAKTPSDYSSTFMSGSKGNNLDGGTNNETGFQ